MKLFLSHLLALTCLIFVPVKLMAQVNYEGQVLDKMTEAPIQNVTVVLVKAKTGTGTNLQGYFNFHTQQLIEKDSLIFTCVGYKTYRMPLSDYKRGMFIALQPSSNELKEVTVRHRKKSKILAEFIKDDLDAQLNWAYNYPFYATTMYAKPFETSKKDAVVSSINLGRWQPNPNDRNPQTAKISQFKVHIMSANPKTGAPDSILATREVFSQDRSRKVLIKFDSTNVILSTKKFFVAI